MKLPHSVNPTRPINQVQVLEIILQLILHRHLHLGMILPLNQTSIKNLKNSIDLIRSTRPESFLHEMSPKLELDLMVEAGVVGGVLPAYRVGVVGVGDGEFWGRAEEFLGVDHAGAWFQPGQYVCMSRTFGRD